MIQLGRNDKCHCGSGKKYKKCCLEKDKNVELIERQIASNSFNHLSYEEVNEMSTEEIISQLDNMGIPFKQEEFLQDIEVSYSAEEISESWFSHYPVTAKGRDEDFPWFAAWILWERLAPEGHLSMEQMNEWMERGIDELDNNDPVSACDHWLKVWDVIKNRKEPQLKDLDYLDEHYRGTFVLSNFCQDLEMELHNAGIEDPAYFEKRISYCREFCEMFPDENELIIHNMRRAIADSFERLGKYKQAEAEFENIVQDFPHNPWSYVGWGDMFFLGEKKDYHKAQKIYEQGLRMTEGEQHRDVLEDRLADLKQEL